MHNNQYGEATLFKYLVNPSLHTVYRYAPDGQVYQIQPGTNEFNMFHGCLERSIRYNFSNSQRYNLMAQAVIIT